MNKLLQDSGFLICLGNLFTNGSNFLEMTRTNKNLKQQRRMRDIYPLRSRLYSQARDSLPALC